MKKYIILFSVTSLLIGGIILGSVITLNAIPTVKIITPSYVDYIEYINTSGSIEESEKSEIKLDVPVVPSEINAEIGDYVEAGYVIATIDRDETVQAVINMNSAAASSDIYSAVLAGNSTDKAISGDIDSMKDTIPTEIISETAGIITGMELEKGSLSAPDKSLIVISNLDNLIAKVTISETNISKVKPGQQVVLTGAGFAGKEYTGVVDKIYPAAHKALSGASQETVVDVNIALKNIDNNIKPGFSVKAKILTSEAQNILMLPYECVYQDEENREYIQVYQKGRAVNRYITTGMETADGVEITEGLQSDEQVVSAITKIPKSNRLVKIKE